VVIGVVGRRDRGGTLAVEALAKRQVRAVIAALGGVSLVARPAEVLGDGVGGVGDPVDLLPGAPADVADPQLVGTRPGRDPERIAKAIGDDPAGVRVSAAAE